MIRWKGRKIVYKQSTGGNSKLNGRSRFGRFFIVIMILVINSPIYAQDQTLEPVFFSEDVMKDRPVSGGIFMGIHSGKIDSSADLSTLSIVIPPGNYSHLCVFVETQDSKYYAEATFDISGSRSELRYHMLFPTEHRQLLESLPIRDISVLAYVSTECKGKEKLYIPVQLQDIKTSQDQVLLLINSQEPGMDVRIYYMQARNYFRCEMDTLSERQVAFNRECLIDVDQGPVHATFVLVRNRFESRMEDITIEVYLP